MYGNNAPGFSAPPEMQTQSFISLQKLETKQSVVNSLGMFLAIAEGYLISKGIKIHPIFAYYDHFNVTSEISELIRLKLMNNYMAYSAQKQNYINKYLEHSFYPDNLSPEQIRNIIQGWIPYANKIGEETLYMNILKLFDDTSAQSNVSYLKEIQGYKDNTQSNKTVDPRNQVKALANFQSHKEEENRKNKERWSNTGKNEINIVLNGKPGTSTLSRKMKTITEKTSEEIREEIDDIEKMKDMTLSLIKKAKDLNKCDINEKKEKKREINSIIENTKQYINEFKKKHGSLEPLWQKIKYDCEVKNPLKKLMEACEYEDYQIFQKIDALYCPDL